MLATEWFSRNPFTHGGVIPPGFQFSLAEIIIDGLVTVIDGYGTASGIAFAHIPILRATARSKIEWRLCRYRNNLFERIAVKSLLKHDKHLMPFWWNIVISTNHY
jgi:hypothetical protein